jgi:ATP-binding cassette subfamily B multidrug efflux pump
MSEETKAAPGQLKETERVQAGPVGPGRGPFGGGMVAQKASTFKPSAMRLVSRMRPYRAKAGAVISLTVVSVALSAIGPRILGRATDLIFAGLLGGNPKIPSGITRGQLVEQLRGEGKGKQADLIASMKDLVPGQGVDFDKVGHVLMIVLAIYIFGSVLAWLAGYILNDVVQGTILTMRSDVEDKVNRLPLSYFDSQPRGELLSRVTNDIDNVSQSLQQTMSQLLTSVLTVFAVLSMMIWISPLLAIVAVVTVPISMVVTGRVMKRSQGMFVQQWRRTGRLNAHIEETFSGHSLVKVFGRRADSERVFAEENEELFKASFSAQFVSGLIMPIMMFVGNLNYVVVAVLGGLRVASGSLSLGEVQAFIQYTRQFTQPLSQVASMANLLQSGVASAERVFELLDAPEEPAEGNVAPVDPALRRGEVRFENVSFSYNPDKPPIRVTRSPSSVRPAPARPPWSTW